MPIRFYSSVDEVKLATSAEPDQFGLSTDQELQTYLEGRLIAAKGIIDTSRKRDFAAEYNEGEIEAVPGAVDDVAREIASNMVVIDRIRRASDTVNLSEYDTKVLQAGPITQSVKDALAAIPQGLEGITTQDRRMRGSINVQSQFYRPYPPGYPIANRDDEWAFGPDLPYPGWPY